MKTIKPPSIQRRLRDLAITLRHTFVPVKDIIPLLLEAADHIDELATPGDDEDEPEDSRC